MGHRAGDTGGVEGRLEGFGETPSTVRIPSRANARVVAVDRLGEGVRGQGESFGDFSDSTASRDPALAHGLLHDVHVLGHALDAPVPDEDRESSRLGTVDGGELRVVPFLVDETSPRRIDRDASLVDHARGQARAVVEDAVAALVSTHVVNGRPCVHPPQDPFAPIGVRADVGGVRHFRDVSRQHLAVGVESAGREHDSLRRDAKLRSVTPGGDAGDRTFPVSDEAGSGGPVEKRGVRERHEELPHSFDDGGAASRRMAVHAWMGMAHPRHLGREFEVHPDHVDEPMDGLRRATAEREGDAGVAPVAVLSENVRGHLLRGVRDPGRALKARPRRGDEAAGDERVRRLARILFEQHDVDAVPERGRGRRGHEARPATSHDDYPGLGRPLHGCATGGLSPPPRGRRRPRSRVPRPPSCLGPPRCGCHVLTTYNPQPHG